MFAVLKTLFEAETARSEAALKQTYALELIDQKIRETETALNAAKMSLATLIQRERAEKASCDALAKRIGSMTNRASEALEQYREDLAMEAANAIAELENEASVRQGVLDRLTQKIGAMRLRLEKGQRRLVSLRQGAIQAKAVRAEQAASRGLASALPGAPAREAQDLIDSIIGSDDTDTLADIYEDLEADMSHRSVEDRLADAGCGPATKVTADAVMARLKQKS
ncbi:MAG: PspA/IM30 family protein [Pseudomonadota bacterium]